MKRKKDKIHFDYDSNFRRQASQTSILDAKKKFAHNTHILEANRITWSTWLRSEDLVSRRAVILPGSAGTTDALFEELVAATGVTAACTTNLFFRPLLFFEEMAWVIDGDCLLPLLEVLAVTIDVICCCCWFLLLWSLLVLDAPAPWRTLMSGTPMSWLKMSFTNSRRVVGRRQFGQFGLLNEGKMFKHVFKISFLLKYSKEYRSLTDVTYRCSAYCMHWWW